MEWQLLEQPSLRRRGWKDLISILTGWTTKISDHSGRNQSKDNRNPKVRKPVILKDWFGEKSGDMSDSSLSSQEEDEGWTEIERMKAKKRKLQERKLKIKEKKERTLDTNDAHDWDRSHPSGSDSIP